MNVEKELQNIGESSKFRQERRGETELQEVLKEETKRGISQQQAITDS